MKLLVFWDVYGRVGRKVFSENISRLKEKYNPDFTIANWENLTSGRGPIEKHILEMKAWWVDLLTSWNHIWDNESRLNWYMDREDSILIRPANYYESDFFRVPGLGYKIIEKNWLKLLVINLMSWVFMKDDMYNPFLKVDEILKSINLDELNWIIVDFHRETTAEIYALTHFLDSRVSFVYGTHTHIQTNDDMIFPGWTSIIWDIWMTGPLYSIIWANYELIKNRYLTWMIRWKIEQELNWPALITGVYLEIDDKTKKTIHIEKFREIIK